MSKTDGPGMVERYPGMPPSTPPSMLGRRVCPVPPRVHPADSWSRYHVRAGKCTSVLNVEEARRDTEKRDPFSPQEITQISGETALIW